MLFKVEQINVGIIKDLNKFRKMFIFSLIDIDVKKMKEEEKFLINFFFLPNFDNYMNKERQINI
jgi:hypothetical protein